MYNEVFLVLRKVRTGLVSIDAFVVRRLFEITALAEFLPISTRRSLTTHEDVSDTNRPVRIVCVVCWVEDATCVIPSPVLSGRACFLVASLQLGLDKDWKVVKVLQDTFTPLVAKLQVHR